MTKKPDSDETKLSTDVPKTHVPSTDVPKTQGTGVETITKTLDHQFYSWAINGPSRKWAETCPWAVGLTNVSYHPVDLPSR